MRTPEELGEDLKKIEKTIERGQNELLQTRGEAKQNEITDIINSLEVTGKALEYVLGKRTTLPFVDAFREKFVLGATT